MTLLSPKHFLLSLRSNSASTPTTRTPRVVGDPGACGSAVACAAVRLPRTHVRGYPYAAPSGALPCASLGFHKGHTNLNPALSAPKFGISASKLAIESLEFVLGVRKTRAMCLTTGIDFPFSAPEREQIPCWEAGRAPKFPQTRASSAIRGASLFIGPGTHAVSGKTPGVRFNAFVSTAEWGTTMPIAKTRWTSVYNVYKLVVAEVGRRKRAAIRKS